MKKTSCLGEFMRYTSLNVLGMVGLSCYILADTFFIAKGLGSDGLAALNIAIPAYSFMHGCGMMLGMGGTTKYSIFRGQKMEKEGSRIFTNTVYLVGIFALIFVLLGLAMTAMLTGSFSNIILDYIFIFPMGIGMFGAAFATGLSPVISIGVLSRHWIARKNNFHFYPEKPDLRLTGTTFSLGIPSLISELASGIVIIVFNFIILGIRGNLGVAAYGVVTNISLVVTSIFTGIAQGMQPIASRSYGKGDAESTRQILRYAIVTLLGTAAVIYGMVFFLASPITAVFNSENDLQLQKIAEEGLRLYFLAAPFVGFNIVSAMFFTSTEQALPAQIISLLRGLFVIIPAAFIMSAVFEMWGVWLSYPVTEGIVTVFAVIVLIKNRKRYGAAA
nr:MATE family efflux transporter [uncultured Blautia sp.]